MPPFDQCRNVSSRGNGQIHSWGSRLFAATGRLRRAQTVIQRRNQALEFPDQRWNKPMMEAPTRSPSKKPEQHAAHAESLIPRETCCYLRCATTAKRYGFEF